MKILRSRDYKQSPWKNGGGVTVEIAIHPFDATVDNFDWRISAATVAENGVFSRFPDIERTLAVLDGNGIILTVDGVETTLTQVSEPFGFAADIATCARLIDGVITDLNVMTKRGLYTHEVTRIEMDGAPIYLHIEDQSFLFVANGSLSIGYADTQEQLLARDCAYFDTEPIKKMQISGNGRAYLIRFKRV